MFTASNILVKARDFYISKRSPSKRRRIFSSSKRKIRFYYGDREDYRNIYLKSYHWKMLKEKKLKESPYCEICGSDKNLDIHHINYKHLFDVEMSDLKTLCRKHHSNIHILPKRKKRSKKQIEDEYIKRYKKKLEIRDKNLERRREGLIRKISKTK